MTDTTQTHAHRIVDSAEDVAIHAAEAIETASERGQAAFTAGSSYVRGHPLLSLGFVLTVSYALSRLLGSR